MLLAELTSTEWILVTIAAFGIGLSKSGLAGVGMIHVVIFAMVFGARDSTGILLPLLIVGDVCAVKLFGTKVQWAPVKRLLPPALIGVVIGFWMMGRLDEATFKPLVGLIILGLTVTQLFRMWRPSLFDHIPHTTWFAWSLGLLSGATTMLANAAGPIVALFLLAVALPKYQLIATGAWFFLIMNVYKVPFSVALGLISPQTLLMNATLAPIVLLGLLAGRRLVQMIPQRLFDSLLLAFTGIASLRLIGIF